MKHPIAFAVVMFIVSLANAQSRDFTAPGAKLEKLAGDLHFIEGPVWIAEGSPSAKDGTTSSFSDIPASKLMKWDGKELSVFREDSPFVQREHTRQ